MMYHGASKGILQHHGHEKFTNSQLLKVFSLMFDTSSVSPNSLMKHVSVPTLRNLKSREC